MYKRNGKGDMDIDSKVQESWSNHVAIGPIMVLIGPSVWLYDYRSNHVVIGPTMVLIGSSV